LPTTTTAAEEEDCSPPLLRFDVDSALSSFSFSGQSAYSKVGNGKTSFPVTQKPAVPLTLQGALWGGLVSGGAGASSACPPPTAEAWRAALPRLRLASGPSPYAFEPLRLTPSQLYLSVFGVPLNISGLEYNLTLTGGGKGGAGAGGAGDEAGILAVSATQLAAYVFSNTSLTGGAKLDPMGGEKFTGFTRPVKVELVEDDGAAAAAKKNKNKTVAATSASSLPSIVLTIPGFNLTFASNTSGSSVAGEGFGTLRTMLNGTLVLRAALPTPSCPPGGCGPYGRCVSAAAAANTTATTTTTTSKCECQCGWALSPKTGRCEVPGGAVCPIFPSGFGGSFGRAASALTGGGIGSGDATACAGEESASALALRGTCPKGFGFNVADKACQRCPDGFGGADCATCQEDAACRSSLPGAPATATCSTGISYDVRSSRKQYTCAVVPEDIVKVVGPTLSFYCDTGAASGAAGNTGGGGSGSGPASPSSTPSSKSSATSVDDSALARATGAFCHIALRLGDMPAGQLAVCRATGCHFAAGRSSWVCDSVSCGCPNGCVADGQDFQSTFAGISGKATLDCEADGGLGTSGGGGGGGGPPPPKGLAAALSGGAAAAGGNGKCSLGVGSLNVRLDLDCQAAECLDSEGPALLGSELPSQRELSTALAPALAAVPSAALLLGTAVCAALALRALPFVKATTTRGGAGGEKAAASAAAVVKRDAAGPVAEAVEGEQEREGGAARGGATAANTNGARPVALSASAAASASIIPGMAAAVLPPQQQRHHHLNDDDQLLLEGGTAPLRELRFDEIDVWVRGKAAAALAAAAAAAEGGAGNDTPGPSSSSTNFFSPNRFRVARKPTTTSNYSAADTEAGYGGGGPTSGGGGGNNNNNDNDNGDDDDDAWHRHSPPPRGAGWRQVLRGVSGALRSGEMTGVMGPSGSGKSTLLHVLTGALAGGGQGGNRWRVRGRVLADGVRVGPGRLARVTALVPQDDLLVRSLTVEESLYYSAALRLDARLPPQACRARVDSVLRDLGLDKVRRSTVLSGATGASGVSGGERRRVAIGMELLTRPGALVLDEPCSGLDAFTAVQLMRTLRRVATEGSRAVALSLHQPSPVMYALLDRAVLVAGGRLVYSGPPMGAGDALAALGAPCPEGVPLAEHLLFAVSDPAVAGTVIGRAAEKADADRAARRRIGGVEAQQQQEQQPPKPPLPPPPPPSTPRPPALKRPGAARQLGVLFWRSLLDVLRNPLLAGLHAAGGLLLGLIVGAIFLRVANDTSGAQNRVGAMFFALCLLAFTSVTTVDLVQAERAAASREVQRRYYSSGLYCLAKLLVDGLCLRALPSVLFCVPFYFLMGLVPLPAQFFTFTLVVVAFSCAVGALALALAALLDSPGKAALLMNMVLLVGVLFAGFLANKDAIPAALRWITYLSVFRYAWEALVINEMKALYLVFGIEGIDIRVTVKGDVFLNIIGVDARMLLVDVAVLVAMWLLFCAFAFWAVWWRYGRRVDVSGDRRERKALKQRQQQQQQQQQQQRAKAAAAVSASTAA
jgi:ABC-type multidrug transport system ATPase subunit